MDVVSDYETVVLLSHEVTIFSTPWVSIVLAERLGFLYRLWCRHGADHLRKAYDAFDQVIRLETCR